MPSRPDREGTAMVDSVRDRADRAAAQSRRFAARGEYEKAIELQRGAIDYWQWDLAAAQRGDDVPVGVLREAAHRLSNNWGKLGGVYRRAGRLPAALEAYSEGHRIETEWGLDDSYNLTNSITIRVLIDPARLPDLAGEIDQAIELVRRQVETTRRDQWWAWADLGQLFLLRGRVSEAIWAYHQLARTHARPIDYESITAVLRALERSLAASDPDHAALCTQALTWVEKGRSER